MEWCGRTEERKDKGMKGKGIRRRKNRKGGGREDRHYFHCIVALDG